MKKIKASMIKMLLRINSHIFVGLDLELASKQEENQEEKVNKKEKKGKQRTRKVGSSSLSRKIFQVMCCMCKFLAKV